MTGRIIHGDATQEAWDATEPPTPRGSFDLYAFTKQAEHGDERRQGLPGWRLPEAVEWAFGRGHDSILIERTGRPSAITRGLTHHVCADPACPGGCA